MMAPPFNAVRLGIPLIKTDCARLRAEHPTSVTDKHAALADQHRRAAEKESVLDLNVAPRFLVVLDLVVRGGRPHQEAVASAACPLASCVPGWQATSFPSKELPTS
jgi:hypothetical protein